jgi:uncharacterized protein with HEPN domain
MERVQPLSFAIGLTMQHDTQHLIDILHSAQRVLEYVADSSIHDFYEDVQLQDSVIRRLLSIGKIAPRISLETRQAISNIDWQAMDDMKSRLMHEGQAIDADHLWEIAQTDAPRLVQALHPLVLTEAQETAAQQITQL